MSQSHRFSQESPFSGSLIDRSKSVEFRFNGKNYSGFEGDSVFTALRANGKLSVKSPSNTSLALDSLLAQKITLCQSDTPLVHTNMFALKVEDGMEIQSLPRPNVFQRLSGSLSLTPKQLQEEQIESASVHQVPSSTEGSRWDMVVVGGGIAGMKAAILAAQKGLQVCLLEKSACLGGMTDYYGRAEQDRLPVELIDELKSQIEASPDITVRLYANVKNVRGNILYVRLQEQAPFRTEMVAFERLILAQGAEYDRYFMDEPVGARVFKAYESYRLAVEYGVMPPKEVTVLTGGNSGYRLAHLFLEHGVHVSGIWDPRVAATSRHIDFAKALGVKNFPGHIIKDIQSGENKVSVRFANGFLATEKSQTQQFQNIIVSDAPVPNISLWARAGGAVSYDEARETFFPISKVQNVEIIGSAAGAITQAECLEQAAISIKRLLGKSKAAKKHRLGAYKFEDPPSPLGYNSGEKLQEIMRRRCNTPGFVGSPGEQACTEYVFSRYLPPAEQHEIISYPDNSQNTGLNEEDLLKPLLGRFRQPKLYMLKMRGNFSLQEGQIIFDSDGVGHTPNIVGIVAQKQRQKIAILDRGKLKSGALVYVRARSGLKGCILGARLD